ncbi:transketolase [Actinobacteria bacterium IMCC25003]|nr:transketolase [Actinobacteria bacterium IMCC25003]
MRNSFVNGLLEEAKKDESILLITGDLGYGVIDRFAQELPKQFLNFGINEQSMMGAAAGLASKGFKPFVYSIGNFPTFRCLEQIRNDVCHMNLNVSIVALGAGFSYGTAGYSHHLVEDISAISVLPNMSLYSPADTLEVTNVLPRMLAKAGPKYIRLGKGGEGQITEKFQEAVPGISIMSGSTDIAVISTGNVLSEVVTAVDALAAELRPTIISVSEFDALVDYIPTLRYRRILTVEEHLLRGGFGSIILELLSQSKSVVYRKGIHSLSSQISGSQQYLRNHYEIGFESILNSIQEINKELSA